MKMAANSEHEGSKESTKKSQSSICCCCCKRGSREVAGDRNGIRLALYSEQASNESAPTIPTFQQELTGEHIELPVKQERKCARKCVKCCKNFTTFLFSNIGLCSAVVAYSILGGFIFQTLEAPNEILKRHQVSKRRESFASDIWKLTEESVLFFEENFTRSAERILIKYQNVVLEAKKNGWDGAEDDVQIPPQWSYAGSLLYSVTVITTIGI